MTGNHRDNHRDSRPEYQRLNRLGNPSRDPPADLRVIPVGNQRANRRYSRRVGRQHSRRANPLCNRLDNLPECRRCNQRPTQLPNRRASPARNRHVSPRNVQVGGHRSALLVNQACSRHRIPQLAHQGDRQRVRHNSRHDNRH